MRQPPEKLDTGASSSALLKPRPSSIACARGRASKPPASLIEAWACAIASPSSAASARSSSASASASAVSPARTKSVAPSSVSGISWATSATRQRAGSDTSPASACSLPAKSEKSDDLPAPFRPTRPTFSPG